MLLYLIGLPTALAMGVVGNLLTPTVRNALVARSAKWKEKRIAKIRGELEFVEQLRAKPSAATAYVGRRVLAIVCEFTLAAAFNAVALILLYKPTPANQTANIPTIIAVLALGILLFITFDMTTAMSFFRGVYDHEWYVHKTTAQLRELGISPSPEGESDSGKQDSGD